MFCNDKKFSRFSLLKPCILPEGTQGSSHMSVLYSLMPKLFVRK